MRSASGWQWALRELLEDCCAHIKTRAPSELAGHTLAEWELRTNYGVTIVGIKRPREDFTYARPETRVDRDDLLIVSGRADLVERFAALD